jgi:Transposase
MGITLSQSEEKKAGSRKGRPNYDPVLRERLAAAACEPGVSVAKLAREHGINANMLFAWRRRYRARQQTESAALIPVVVNGIKKNLSKASRGSLLFRLSRTPAYRDGSFCSVHESGGINDDEATRFECLAQDVPGY